MESDFYSNSGADCAARSLRTANQLKSIISLSMCSVESSLTVLTRFVVVPSNLTTFELYRHSRYCDTRLWKKCTLYDTVPIESAHTEANMSRHKLVITYISLQEGKKSQWNLSCWCDGRLYAMCYSTTWRLKTHIELAFMFFHCA